MGAPHVSASSEPKATLFTSADVPSEDMPQDSQTRQLDSYANVSAKNNYGQRKERMSTLVLALWSACTSADSEDSQPQKLTPIPPEGFVANDDHDSGAESSLAEDSAVIVLDAGVESVEDSVVDADVVVVETQKPDVVDDEVESSSNAEANTVSSMQEQFSECESDETYSRLVGQLSSICKTKKTDDGFEISMNENTDAQKEQYLEIAGLGKILLVPGSIVRVYVYEGKLDYIEIQRLDLSKSDITYPELGFLKGYQTFSNLDWSDVKTEADKEALKSLQYKNFAQDRNTTLEIAFDEKGNWSYVEYKQLELRVDIAYDSEGEFDRFVAAETGESQRVTKKRNASKR